MKHDLVIQFLQQCKTASITWIYQFDSSAPTCCHHHLGLIYSSCVFVHQERLIFCDINCFNNFAACKGLSSMGLWWHIKAASWNWWDLRFMEGSASCIVIKSVSLLRPRYCMFILETGNENPGCSMYACVLFSSCFRASLSSEQTMRLISYKQRFYLCFCCQVTGYHFTSEQFSVSLFPPYSHGIFYAPKIVVTTKHSNWENDTHHDITKTHRLRK